jgi:hypothetical protein
LGVLANLKSLIWNVWAAPGAPRTLPKGLVGRGLPPFANVSGTFAAAQTPKIVNIWFAEIHVFKKKKV